MYVNDNILLAIMVVAWLLIHLVIFDMVTNVFSNYFHKKRHGTDAEYCIKELGNIVDIKCKKTLFKDVVIISLESGEVRIWKRYGIRLIEDSRSKLYEHVEVYKKSKKEVSMVYELELEAKMYKRFEEQNKIA